VEFFLYNRIYHGKFRQYNGLPSVTPAIQR